MSKPRAAALFLSLLLACAAFASLLAAPAALLAADPDAPLSVDQAALGLLVGELKDRVAAVAALRAIDSPESTDTLVLATLDTSADVRRLAYNALGARDIDVSFFRRGLADDAPAVRVATVAAVAELSSTPRLELLVGSLSHSDEAVAVAAGRALLQSHPRAIPPCDALARLWRAAKEASKWQLEMTLAALMNTREVSSCTLSTEDVERLRAQSALFQELQTHPELGAALARYPRELDALDARFQKVLALDDGFVASACGVYLDTTNTIVLPIEQARQQLALGLNGSGNTLLEVRRLLTSAEASLNELERCADDPRAYGGVIGGNGGGGGHNSARNLLAPLELTLGFESTYDDHFLARRQDVADLRVMDELITDLALRAKLLSPPPAQLDDLVYRARLQLSDTLMIEETELSRLGAYADFTHRQRFGPELTLFSAFEAERDPADEDRAWPRRLIAPGLHARGLVGAKSQIRNEPNDAYGYPDGDWDRFPDWAVAIGASVDHYDAHTLGSGAKSDLLPAQLGDSTLFDVEVDGLYKFYRGYEEGAYVDIEGSVDAVRNGRAFMVAVEPGVFYEDHESLVLAQVGASFAHYPAPTDSALAAVSGMLYIELAEDQREDYSDGGQIWAALTADRFDDPTLADASSLYGLASGFTIVEHESDFVLEFDFAILGQALSRSVLAGDPTSYRAGFTTFLHFHPLGFPGFSIGYSLMGEQDDLREERFLEQLGEEHSRGIIRNQVMLNLYGASFYPDLDLLDDRSPDWGRNRLRTSNVPLAWWQR